MPEARHSKTGSPTAPATQSIEHEKTIQSIRCEQHIPTICARMFFVGAQKKNKKCVAPDSAKEVHQLTSKLHDIEFKYFGNKIVQQSHWCRAHLIDMQWVCKKQTCLICYTVDH